jgi:L-ribulose-5-phosphate 3-epimerase UlaE
MKDTMSIDVALSSCNHPFIKNYIERIKEAVVWANKNDIVIPIETMDTCPLSAEAKASTLPNGNVR